MLCASVSNAIAGLDRRGDLLASRKWLVVRGLLSPDDTAAIRAIIESERETFCVDRIAQGQYHHGHRLYRTNIRALFPLHVQLTEWMSVVFKVPLDVSYSFCLINKRDYVLRPHRDQPACKYSLDIAIAKTCDSCIYMEDEPIQIDPGDAIAYFACDVTHRRDVLRGDNEIVNLVYHWIDAS